MPTAGDAPHSDGNFHTFTPSPILRAPSPPLPSSCPWTLGPEVARFAMPGSTVDTGQSQSWEAFGKFAVFLRAGGERTTVRVQLCTRCSPWTCPLCLLSVFGVIGFFWRHVSAFSTLLASTVDTRTYVSLRRRLVYFSQIFHVRVHAVLEVGSVTALVRQCGSCRSCSPQVQICLLGGGPAHRCRAGGARQQGGVGWRRRLGVDS